MESSKQEIANILDKALNSVNKNTRNILAETFNDKIFVPVYDISLRNSKELALERLKKVISTKVVSIRDFLTNPENIFTVHEMLGFVDGSLATKFTVQYNLFGGTIVGLGTERHEKYFDDIDCLNIIGCFCLTELGYGNNAVEMETTAVWDQDKQVFVINTPTVLSQKYWITNGAYHANHAVVFAQTIVNKKNEGINAFIIRLRDEEKKLCTGVTIDDMGCKQGMNGVDNARIILRGVESKKENLLNKLADMGPNGQFVSTISNRRQRFLAASNRLLSGRICIASMLISGAKLVLLIANKFASVRLSNGKTGKSDTPISKFQLFQNQVVPLMSRAIVLNIGLLYVRTVYSDYLLNADKYDAAQFNNVLRLVCVIKPMVAWLGNEIGNVCRERTGGQGYLSINRIEELIPMAHAAITAEGDSAVLMQKVSKEYVEDFARNLVAPPALTESAEALRKKTDIFNIETLLNLIKLRESLLLKSMTKKTITKKNEIFEVWMLNESDLIQDLAKTFGERMCLEQSYLKLKGTNPILEQCILLVAAKFVKNNLDWFLLSNSISKEAALLLHEQVNELIKSIGIHSLDICEGFGVPKNTIFAPIYTGYEEYYKSDITNGEHYQHNRAKF